MKFVIILNLLIATAILAAPLAPANERTEIEEHAKEAVDSSMVDVTREKRTGCGSNAGSLSLQLKTPFSQISLGASNAHAHSHSILLDRLRGYRNERGLSHAHSQSATIQGLFGSLTISKSLAHAHAHGPC